MGHMLNETEPEKQPLLPTTNDPDPSQLQNSVFAGRTDNINGYILMCLSTLGFAGMALLVRIAESKYNFPALSSVVVRGFFQMVLAAVAISFTTGFRTAFQPLTDKRLSSILLIRTISGSFGLICMFQALKRLPLGECQTIFFSNPVFVMILSFVFLNEHITIVDMIAVVTSLSGIALVANPLSDDHDAIPAMTRITGSIFAFLAAFCSAIAYTSIRTISASVHYLVNVFAFGVVCFIISATLADGFTLDFIQTNKTGLGLVCLSALFAFMGQCLLTKALQYCKAGPGVLLRNLDVPILYLLGLIFLNEVPSAIRLLGSAIVLASAITIGVNRLLRS